MLSKHEMQVHTRAINVMIVLSNSIFEVSIVSFSGEITAGGKTQMLGAPLCNKSLITRESKKPGFPGL